MHYAKELDGTSATRMWIVELDGRDIGYMQDYPVIAYDDYAVRVQDPEAIAFDYLIGVADLVDRGIGTEMITAFCRTCCAATTPMRRASWPAPMSATSDRSGCSRSAGSPRASGSSLSR